MDRTVVMTKKVISAVTRIPTEGGRDASSSPMMGDNASAFSWMVLTMGPSTALAKRISSIEVAVAFAASTEDVTIS